MGPGGALICRWGWEVVRTPRPRVEMQGVGELVAGGGEGVWVHMQNVRHRVSPLAPQLTSSAT